MKIYRSNKKSNSLFRKINWIKIFIVLAIIFTISFGVLSLLSQFKSLSNCIRTSSIIAVLIGLEFFLIDFYDNRDRIYFVNKNKISYIEIHEDRDGKLLTNTEYRKYLEDATPKEIYENQEKFEGVDKGEIIEVISIRKRINKTVAKVKVKSKEWDCVGRFTITKMFLNDKEKTKKFIIMNDYEDYKELINCFEKNKR